MEIILELGGVLVVTSLLWAALYLWQHRLRRDWLLDENWQRAKEQDKELRNAQ